MLSPAHDVSAPAGAAPAPRRTRVLVALLLAASGLFLAYGWGVIPAPFGDSHDGRNAGVWLSGARAIGQEGPVRSRLGTRSRNNGVYANHPPLIVVEIALAERIGGRSPAATRAPAWLGSLASVWLLAAILRQRGLRAPPVGAALLLTVATPMFLVFGTMLDTPVTSMPFGLGLLLLWERSRGGRRVSPPLAAGVACLAVLAGWQSLLVAGAVGVWAVARRMRRRGGGELAFAAGALVGAGLLVAWLWWAFGGTFRPLAGAYLFRTGQGAEPVPLAELASRQVADVRAMFGALVVPGVIGLVLALRRGSTRGLAAVALAVSLPYPVVFRAGAVNHEYWDYWFLIPLAVGLAVLGDWVVRALPGYRRTEPLLVGGAVVVAGIMGAGAWLHPTAAGWAVHEGVRAGAVVQRVALPDDQAAAWYAGAVGQTASWLSLPTRRPAVHVAAEDISRLAAEHPGDLVLVGMVRCPAAGSPHIDYSLERPADLVAKPPEVSRCGSG